MKEEDAIETQEKKPPSAADLPVSEGADESNLEAEDFEPESLSPRQWLYVTLSVFVSFVLFTILFFPLEDLVRFAMYKNLPGISLGHLDLNYFGKDKVNKLSFHQGAIFVEASSLESGLSWLALGRRSLQGPLLLRSIEIAHPALGLKAAKLRLSLDLGPLDFSGNSKEPLSGEIKLLLNSVVLGQIAPIGIEAGLLKASEARIHAVFQEGAVDLRDFEIKSNAFRIEIKNGSLGASRNLATAPLRGKLCLTPRPALREDEKLATIRTLYELAGGNVNERFCTELKGTFGKPGLKSQAPNFSTDPSEATNAPPGLDKPNPPGSI